MSYDVYLADIDGEPIYLDEPHDQRGGTYELGGTREAWLNVTYNYGPILRRVLGPDGIRTLYGRRGIESIPLLINAIEMLDDDVSEDYWEATEGNVRVALSGLLFLAQRAPQGIWKGD